VEVFVDSPFGTRSVLATPHGDRAVDYPVGGWKFGTVRHWGENSNGLWKVSCKDATGAGQGTFVSFQLTIYGYKRK
jgi:subtilisin-like proprotein convertase family protein